MPDDFRARITERNVARGLQGRADADAVKAHNRVTSPESSLCRTLAVEAAKDIDRKYRERR
jgi:hypothetical protein